MKYVVTIVIDNEKLTPLTFDHLPDFQSIIDSIRLKPTRIESTIIISLDEVNHDNSIR